MPSALIIMNAARELAASLITVIFFAWFGALFFKCPMRPRRMILCTLINFVFHLYTRLWVPRELVSYAITAADLLIVTRVLWHPRRGFAYWTAFFFGFIAEIALELVGALLYTGFTPHPEIVGEFAGHEIYLIDPKAMPALLICGAVAMLGPLLIVQAFKKTPQPARKPRSRFHYLLRFALILVILIAVMIFYGRELDTVLYNEANTSSPLTVIASDFPQIVVYVLTAALLLFYGLQDIQQYKLHLKNQTLEDRNVAYQRVIDTTREFRHNIANMIYGLEGVILTQDIGQIEQYYTAMTRRCALINNENAVALNRLTDASLTALLLRKLDTAREKAIPVYLNVDSGFEFDALPSHALCEALGCLIDNALEAAEKSDAPQVNMTLRSADTFDEILLDNTYAADADLGFLTGNAVSSKPGHRAVGLGSVRRQLGRYRDVCLNQYVQGRFIETSLCRYR